MCPTKASEPVGRFARFVALCKARWGMNRRPAEWLYLCCWGITRYDAQARAMGISRQSLRVHRWRAFRALGAHCQAQAVALAWPVFMEAAHGTQ